MLTTRVIGAIGGGFVLFFVVLSTDVSVQIHERFLRLGYILIAVSVISTIPLAWTHTRRLRLALKLVHRHQPLPPDLARQATREAFRFPFRQSFLEALTVPLLSALPMCLDLSLRFDVSASFILQIVIATFLAVGLVLLLTFFGGEQWMGHVIADLMAQGGAVDFDELPKSRLQARMMLCFSIIILITGVFIGALIYHETLDLSRISHASESVRMAKINQAVDDIRIHSIMVTLGAIAVGCAYSRWLAKSLTGRLHRLVKTMQAVQAGDLSVRLMPTGNDELDLLTRRFNDMISVLDRQDATVRELNASLESQVASRTNQLQRSLVKLQELDRMKTEFFSNVSHELRTPLMMILSPIRQLQNEIGESVGARSRSLLEVAHGNGQRLLKQINQLLDFSKVEAGQVTVEWGPVQLNDVVQRLAMAIGPLAQNRGVQLEVDLDSRMPITESDEEKLDTVLTNLLSNAVKFTPPDGLVRLVSRLVESDVAGQTLLQVVVEDTGKGIAAKDFDRLFQRFVQLDGSTSREYAGTGLGLAMVRELMTLLGGRVWVESELGIGSRFHIELPWKLVRQNGSDSTTTTSSERSVPREAFADLYLNRIEPADSHVELPASAQTILVVDDNPGICDLLVGLLSREYRVLTAEDGLQALSILESRTPDLIISDVMMPVIDGQELCRRIKDRHDTKSIPFILLTARSKTSMKVVGFECGADDYICKPFEDAELLARVRALLRVRLATLQVDQRNVQLEKMYNDLVMTQKQLAHAEKLSSLGQLVAGLAHEINNSINAVYNGVPAMKLRLQKLRLKLSNDIDPRSNVQLSPEVAASFEKLDTLANVIADGAERTARIVSDMKTFAHPGRERDEDFDVHRALNLCLNLAVKHSSISVQVERDYDEIPIIHGPYCQLHQVFLNLMSNAVQAMHSVGTLHVCTRRNEDSILLKIRDTGEGIPADIRHKIFEPFFTTKAPGVGTGLGLSISYSIVNKLGGTLECDSEPGQGTEFRICIPLPPHMVNAISLTANSQHALSMN